MRIIRDASGALVIDESAPECTKCIARGLDLIEKCPIDRKQARHTLKSSAAGSIFDCEKKHGFVKSLKMHEAKIDRDLPLLESLIQFQTTISKRYEKDYNRLLHNLVTHNAHSIQEFQTIASEAELIAGGQRQLEVLSEIISRDKNAASTALLRMFQNAVAIKNEISTYKRLYRSGESLSLKMHEVHKILMNAAYKFFSDFNEINVIVAISPTNQRLLIDYDCVSIILYHILDNARKYVLPHTRISVGYLTKGDRFLVQFRMDSLWIDADELEKIYHEGYSGKHVKASNLQGTGYGLSIVRDLAARCRAEVEFDISNQEQTRRVFNGKTYGEKTIMLSLPLS
jgi:K+-sensing histidine kinase KdpD